jgi:hypothetical protein
MKATTMAVCACAALTLGGNAFAQGAADNTNSKTAPAPFQTWMSDYSKANRGYISRQAYMDEMGRRWDAVDTNRQGLTTQQINSIYGYSAGATTPGRVKPGNAATNPTGTEPKGQNSGGK